jgi:hypothetical protein
MAFSIIFSFKNLVAAAPPEEIPAEEVVQALKKRMINQ